MHTEERGEGRFLGKSRRYSYSARDDENFYKRIRYALFRVVEREESSYIVGCNILAFFLETASFIADDVVDAAKAPPRRRVRALFKLSSSVKQL